MPDPVIYQGYTDPLSASFAGMQDYLYVAEGPTITVDGTGIIELTAGLQNLDGTGTVHTINGGTRNGKFAILRFGSSGIQFGSGGNVRAASGVRTINRWMKILYRDGFWEEQSLSSGDFAGGVTSFKARTGTVIPLLGDYSAALVTATDPTGLGATTVQGTLTNLKTQIDGVAPTGLVKSFNARQNIVVPLLGDYTAAIVGMSSFTVGGTTIPGPTIQQALVQIVTAMGGVAPGGVLTFAGRAGTVVGVLGDYTASLITATDPTGLGATQSQAVMNNLMTKINLVSGGTGITGINTQAQSFGSGSPGYPTFTANWGDYPAEFISYNGLLATNALLRSAITPAQALNAIPDLLLTAYGDHSTYNNWSNSGAWQFGGLAQFHGGLESGGTMTAKGDFAVNIGGGFNEFFVDGTTMVVDVAETHYREENHQGTVHFYGPVIFHSTVTGDNV